MTVTVEPGALQLEHDGETVYFCAPGCKKTYEREHMSASASGDAPAGTKRKKIAMAIDPICGMTVKATPETLHLEHHGETVYFCRDECKTQFQKEQHAVAAK
jgi:xanthine dehydrogenase accessory factor